MSSRLLVGAAGVLARSAPVPRPLLLALHIGYGALPAATLLSGRTVFGEIVLRLRARGSVRAWRAEVNDLLNAFGF